MVEVGGWEGGGGEGEEDERLGGVFEGACAVVFGGVRVSDGDVGYRGIVIKVLFKRGLR